jgi:pepF/M3 family oligoendopeptidase
MNLEWSLKELYDSFECDNFNVDLQSFKLKISDFILWCEHNLSNESEALHKLEKYIDSENELGKFTTLLIFCELNLSVMSENSNAIKYLDILEELYSKLSKPRSIFKLFVKNINNLDSIIDESILLTEHKYYLNEVKKSSIYMLSEKEETLISKMKITGSSTWSKMRDQLTSNLLVDIEIEGNMEQLPISVVRNYAYSSDSELRKNAYYSEMKSYEKIDKSIAFSLNAIKGEVITIANMRGYKSPLEMTVLDSKMEMKTLNTMQRCIKNYLPIFHKYYKRKSELLNHKNGLPFYDLFAPLGNLKIQFTYDEAMKYIIENFSTFSSELSDFAKKVYENRWIDVEPRIGKRDGAFSHNMHVIKESRIMTNFTGSFNDLLTLAHEIGHSYHDSCIAEETYLNSSYSMPIAETASIFCETIITNAAISSATEEEAIIILENDISGSALTIVDIYSRFLFEDELFNRRTEGTLSSAELDEIMLKAQKKAYGISLDSDFLHPRMWICKPHYYSADINYYNFPYAFGLLFSKGLYATYLKDKQTFQSKYINMLSSTSKNNIKDVANLMNIDLNNESFWNDSLELIKENIDEFLEITK